MYLWWGLRLGIFLIVHFLLPYGPYSTLCGRMGTQAYLLTRGNAGTVGLRRHAHIPACGCERWRWFELLVPESRMRALETRVMLGRHP
jgi:hypothetical protein